MITKYFFFIYKIYKIYKREESSLGINEITKGKKNKKLTGTVKVGELSELGLKIGCGMGRAVNKPRCYQTDKQSCQISINENSC